eukprot:ANDGO_06597.mRNA.1 hypothetical protein
MNDVDFMFANHGYVPRQIVIDKHQEAVHRLVIAQDSSAAGDGGGGGSSGGGSGMAAVDEAKLHVDASFMSLVSTVVNEIEGLLSTQTQIDERRTLTLDSITAEAAIIEREIAELELKVAEENQRIEFQKMAVERLEKMSSLPTRAASEAEKRQLESELSSLEQQRNLSRKALENKAAQVSALMACLAHLEVFPRS